MALIALLIGGMGLAPPGGAQVDQCAPPGIESASALPTNLAAAAKGPGEDKYTTRRSSRSTASTSTRSGSASQGP